MADSTQRIFVCAACNRASCLSCAAPCEARLASRRPGSDVAVWSRSELEQLGREVPEYWDTPNQEMWTALKALYPNHPAHQPRTMIEEVAGRR